MLDSEDGSIGFDDLYVNAVIAPESAEARADALADRVRALAVSSRSYLGVLGSAGDLDPSKAQKIANHRMPYWTERMTLSYLRAESDRGGQVEADDVGYRLRWPSGDTQECAVFSRTDAEIPGATFLSMEDPRVRRLTDAPPPFAPGQPIVSVVLDGISDKVAGIWSLWRIALRGQADQAHRILPLFVTDQGRVLVPTARAVWDRLIDIDRSANAIRDPTITGDAAMSAFDQTRREAERQGHSLFSELLGVRQRRLARQRRNESRTFEARRKMIGRLGLPQVRDHRLRELERDETQWREGLADQSAAFPELTALLILRVAPSGNSVGTT